MTALEREKNYIRKWRPKAVQGNSIAMSNVAAAYRILGNLGLAARWYKRAAQQRDGDALTDWGYCLQHDAGIRKDEASLSPTAPFISAMPSGRTFRAAFTAFARREGKERNYAMHTDSANPSCLHFTSGARGRQDIYSLAPAEVTL